MDNGDKVQWMVLIQYMDHKFAEFCLLPLIQMSNIFIYIYTRDIPEIYKKYTRDIPEIYQRYTSDIPEIYQRYTKDVPDIYQR